MPRVDYISINQSKLYRIGTKRDLAEILDTDLPTLKVLTADQNYQEWAKKTPGKKDRVIENPVPKLARVLNRLQYFLRRIDTPAWLLSGKKCIRPQDNAAFHASMPYMITTDIAQFYQSTKREYIYLAFRNFFLQTDDVASLLADLVTYKGHIPTGAATSQLLAFWAYRPTFERLHKLAATQGITMSIWVDDITFSSAKSFPKNWVRDIQKIAQEVGLTFKADKTKHYYANDFKTVTGSIITPDGRITVKNQKRKELLNLMKDKRIEMLSLKEARSVFGKLSAQRQNDPEFFDVVYARLKRHLRNLEQKNKKSA